MSDHYALIAFTSYWGSKFGGINAFNADFLEAMGAAYDGKVDVICVVLEAEPDDIKDAQQKNITLIPLPYKPSNPHLGKEQAQAAVEEISKTGISFDPNKTIWLGHDRISGEAALEAAKIAGGRSAIIHHMSYDHYEAFAENAQSANKKRTQQKSLFDEADILMAVGPLLRDALEDLNDRDVKINMIIPGLADIEPKQKAPNTFSMFVSGRFSNDALKVKQGQLAVAAFAKSYLKAKNQGQPESLFKRPKLVLRGIDFESEEPQNLQFTSSEENLKKFAAEYADGAALNLQALPYTKDRDELFNDLKASSVAAMPSWHEGFGLVAWEAIAAGIPLILSKDSGVYELIKENHPGFAEGQAWVVNIDGQVEEPYFSDADLETVSSAILKIAIDPKTAREKAIRLREELADYTWATCAEQVARFFDWDIQKGVINESQIVNVSSLSNVSHSSVSEDEHSMDNSGLFMPKPAWDINQGMAVSVLLRASEALVPFDNYRMPELAKLQTWAMETNYPTSIRLLKGEGGAGKTRLAIELCNQLKKSDWHVGFLEKDLKSDELSRIWESLRLDGKPSLIIIDYAETRTNELLALIKLVLNKPTKENVCILLLARDGGEWWDDLAAQDPVCEALLSGYATSGPYALPPLYKTLGQRQQGYQNALKAFSQVLGIEASKLIPDLTGDHFGKPLFIQMSALLTLHGELPKSADGIIRAILNHEQRYWMAALKNTGIYVPDLTVRNLLALVTLTGNFATAKEARSYWNTVDDLNMSAVDFSRLFNCLAPLYPGYQGLQAVKPDLLGEALVADMLLKSTGPALLSTVLNKSATNKIKQNALTLLARLSLYKPALNPIIEEMLAECAPYITNEVVTVSRETQSHLPELMVAAIGKLRPNIKNSVTSQLSTLIKYESVALNILNCEVSRLIYEKEKLKAEKKTNAILAQVSYFQALYQYSLALYFIGQPKESCFKAEQAVEISKLLAKHELERYEPHYATALNNYANRLSDIGQNEQAVEFAKKSLDIRKCLAEQNSDRYESDYASSLNTYANRLGDIGQNEHVIEFTKKSLDIYERLSKQNPDKYEPAYSASLNNYATHLSNTSLNKQAIEYAKKSLEIYKRLAEHNPDRYEPDYAMSLNNYASHLNSIGLYEQAIEYAKKSLEIYERLTEHNPDRYEPDYAMSLGNYASYQNDIGQLDAIKKQTRAIEILSSFYQKLPRKYAFSIGILTLNRQLTLWIIDNKLLEKSAYMDEDFQQYLMPHENTIFELNQLFIKGVITNNTDDKKSAFNKIFQTYPGITGSEREMLEEYWHCASAWLYCNNIQNEQINLWLDEWQAFKKRRSGNVPKWMLDFAKKTEIKWP